MHLRSNGFRKKVEWPKDALLLAVAKSSNLTEVLKALGEKPRATMYPILRKALKDLEIDTTVLETRKTTPMEELKRRKHERDSRRKDTDKRARAANENTPRWILEDSRKSDKLKNLLNNMDVVFIANTIQNGCHYCGETKLRMTLDRIDNDKGHTKDNVLPACIRCNYMRRSMPYQAWDHIKTSVRSAKELGLFGDWTGRCR